MRSATAPLTSATAMIAKAAWKPTNASAGTVPTTASGPSRAVSPAKSKGLPTRPPKDSPNTMEKPNSTQRTPTIPIVTTDIITMFSTLFARTIPP